ncbi:flagellar motor protein MotB [Paenarthrobacter sp. NPDC056912]|uniref:OmpA/MotB family protein n=1 Tax=Paenarthrobacter sp. NPDC056912 TaxID=3345965 RepID=UPI003670CE3F
MRSRRKRGSQPEEHHVDERWMASYMDMVTVLMCMFIVLFAMSSVDQVKFEKLRNSLATGFGTEISQKVDTASGVVVPSELTTANGEGFSALDLAIKEADKLTALQNAMQAKLDGAGLAANVQFVVGERGLTVKLVGSQTFFQPDMPDLTPKAVQILNTIAPTVVGSGLEVMVEGHAAKGVTAFASTWELSAARSVNVLRYFVDNSGMPPGRIGAVAFGAARQVTDDSTEELMELNRRVDVVLLSASPEDVRALIPGAIEAQTQETAAAAKGAK